MQHEQSWRTAVQQPAVIIHLADVRVSTQCCAVGSLDERATVERQQSFDPESKIIRERVQASQRLGPCNSGLLVSFSSECRGDLRRAGASPQFIQVTVQLGRRRLPAEHRHVKAANHGLVVETLDPAQRNRRCQLGGDRGSMVRSALQGGRGVHLAVTTHSPKSRTAAIRADSACSSLSFRRSASEISRK